MITDWADLVGRTPIRVVPFTLGGYILYFEDGECAHIDGDGEEVHGTHWPILSDEYERLIPDLRRPNDGPD
jgi:hypothetical protein